MRLREHTLKQRTLCLAVVVLLLAPVASAMRLPVPRSESSSPPPILHAEDVVAGLKADSARSTGSLPWVHEDGWYLTETAKYATGKLSIVVEGLDVLAFRYDAPRAGAMGIVVDNGATKWLPAGDGAVFDLPLDGLKHTIAWSVVAQAGDALGVRVEGVEPIANPVALDVPVSVSLCNGETISIRIGWAQAIAPETLRVTIDGVPVTPTGHDTKRLWNLVETTLQVPLPPQDVEQRTANVVVEVLLPDGRIVEVVNALVDIAVNITALVWDLPSGWEYDLTPTIGVHSLCLANPVVDLTLTVDGQDVTRYMDPWALGLLYTFDHELAFGEEHTYTLVAKLRYGPTFTFERTFKEGLDVLELDPELGYMTFLQLPSAWAMVSPTNMETLPPVRTGSPPDVGSHSLSRTFALQSDAHLRAVYAPLILRCDPLVGVCDPYGNLDACDGFLLEGVYNTKLTVSGLGKSETVPTLGQLVAASHFSRIDTSNVEDMARDLAEDVEG